MGKRIGVFVCAWLIIVPLLVAASPAAASVRVRVNVKRGIIRSGPGVGYEVVLQMPQGTILETVGRTGHWFEVLLPGDRKTSRKNGFIHEDSVSVTAETPRPQSGTVPGAGVSDQTGGRFEINLMGGGGYTAVDIVKDWEIQENCLEDWDKINWRLLVQGIYKLNSRISVGGEFGFINLYYFYWQSPAYSYGHNVHPSSKNLSGVIQFRLANHVFSQTGAGIYFRPESTMFGCFGALGGEIPIGQNISIPVMVRFDWLIGGPSPLSLLLGLKLKLH